MPIDALIENVTHYFIYCRDFA